MGDKPLWIRSGMPQNKINILSTRLLDDEFTRELEGKDILIDALPFIKTEPISATELLKKIQEALATTTTIVFTSANAVEPVASKIEGQQLIQKIFCIGHSTKQSAVKYFGEISIAGVADNAKELATAILDANVSELIFFCGDQRRDELPALLKKYKVNVTEIIVYKTIATPKKIEKKYEAILFFSPSAVKSFFECNLPGNQTVLFAIGNTTAEEIRNYSKNKIVISDAPDANILLQTAVKFFQNNPIHH